MSSLPVAVLAALEARDAIQRRRQREAQQTGDSMEARRRQRQKAQENKALRDEYVALLQGASASSGPAGSPAAAAASERVKALRRMVLVRGLPTEAEPNGGGADDACSLRGLVWKLLLGALHVDAMLYIRLVEQGASWSDAKIRDDTFRTFRGDLEFQKRVPEDKLSRLNNAFVRLNFPDGGLEDCMGGSGEPGFGDDDDLPVTPVTVSETAVTASNGGRGTATSSPFLFEEEPPSADREKGGLSLQKQQQHNARSEPYDPPVGSSRRAHETNGGNGGKLVPNESESAQQQQQRRSQQQQQRQQQQHRRAGSGGGGAASGDGTNSRIATSLAEPSTPSSSLPNALGGYVQGMTILCAPLLFVMPEVDAFFAFHALLTRHIPRYVNGNLDGVHVGCGLVDRALAAVDPALYNYLQSKFLGAAIYAFPLLMSLHACLPPLDEALRLWDALFAFGVHLEVLLVVAQCVLLRDRLLHDPNPFNHLSPRYLPPIDADVLVAAAFAVIPHVPDALMEEIIAHPFIDPAQALQATAKHNDNSKSGSGGGDSGSGTARRDASSADVGGTTTNSSSAQDVLAAA